MKVIAIGGEPGSGKSTLMKVIMEALGVGSKVHEDFKLVPYHKNNNTYVLGKYEDGEVFSGTDRMSMAVQPEAIKFLDTLPEDSVVLFEGDRLFTASFLENCAEKYDTKIIYLQTDKATRKERYAERGSNQNETWLAGRESKIANIMTNFDLMFLFEKLPHNTLEEQKKAVDFIVKLV